jgi:glutamate/tyrosine decarboxylase-like PLP-dependent enzyme
MAAEMLAGLTNTSMYTFKVGGPQVLIEQEVLGRMARLAGLDQGQGTFLPGGSISNLTAMLIARNEALEDARERGLDGSRLTVYTSDQSHYSIRKNAGILGIGRANTRLVPTDDEGRMRPDELERLVSEDLAAGARPILVNATSGTTVLGAFDPLREVAAVARRHGVWLHVDACLGGSFLLCPELRPLLDGSELADSFAWNAHKMMGVGLQCSALILARPDLLARHLNETADYLFQAHEDELNPGTRSLQCGRRNDALKLWAAWKLLGDEGYAERVRRQRAVVRRAVELIEADPELELVLVPACLNVCFEVLSVDARDVCTRLDAERRLKIGYGEAKGRRFIRLVCVNPELDDDDLGMIFGEIRTVADALRG